MEYSREETFELANDMASMTEDTTHINDLFGDLPPVSAPAVAIVRTLHEAGYTAYLVGGAVRDLILGIAPGDFDVATDALPDQIAALFQETKFVGAAFGVMIVRSNTEQVEVATFRHEGVYLDGRHPERVEFSASMADDAQRRDFTVNALYLDPLKGIVHDHVGGLDDCRTRTLRTVGEPADRFAEDGLRLLRAARFAAACDLDVKTAVRQAMRACRRMMCAVSPERIAQELTRMLTGPSPSRALDLMRETGLLDEFLPEISALHGVPQPPDYHPEGDVWTHTLLMLEELETSDAALALAVLLHDVGKPRAMRRTGGRVRFHGHDRIGMEMAREILERLRFSRAIIDKVATMVLGHMKFFDAPRMKPATLKRFMRQAHFEDLLELHRLDKLAADGNLSTYDFCRSHLEDSSDDDLAPLPLLTGNDLLAMGVTPGPRVGEMLRELETEQLEGRLNTVPEAKLWVHNQLGDRRGR